jgi:hypothetical protein
MRTVHRPLRRGAALALASFALLLAGSRAASAADVVPASGVGANTFVVGKIDINKMTPASLDSAAKAVLGPLADNPKFREGLDEYRQKYDQYTKAGAESVTMVMSGDPTKDEKEPQPVVYLKLKPGSDPAAVEQMIRADQEKNKAKNPNQKDTDITHEGDYIVMREKGAPVAPGGDAAKARSFGDILAGSDKAISFAFIPTDPIRTKMKEADPNQPTWMKALAPLLADSKSMRLDVALGDSPTLGLIVQAADEGSAKGIVDAATQGTDQLKQQAAAMKQAPPQFQGMADALNGLAEALKPTASGNQVTMNVQGKALAPIIANIAPMFMGLGGGPGGGGPAPKPGGGL